ncbi:MAG: SRPBCC family protein [Aeromicrobium sp.]
MKVDASIVIHRPVEAVWVYMTDFANATVINPAAREQRLTSAGPLQKGSTYVWIGELWGRRFESNAELTEFELNRRWAYRSTSGSNASSGSYTLEPVADGTRVTVTGDADVGWVGRLFGPLIARTVRRNLDTGLAKAKAALEAQG